jgi:hypothetical protein
MMLLEQFKGGSEVDQEFQQLWKQRELKRFKDELTKDCIPADLRFQGPSHLPMQPQMQNTVADVPFQHIVADVPYQDIQQVNMFWPN